MSEYKLQSQWILWNHGLNDKSWTNDSYKNIFTFNNLNDIKIYNDNLDLLQLQNSMYFLMREDIFPTWEDSNNKNGCCASYKIPSNDIVNTWHKCIQNILCENLHKNMMPGLVKRILNTKKEVIISSEKNPKKLELYGNSNIKWLYVVPKYPCKLEELDFSKLNDFDGYSNHCDHFLAPLSAVILGAKMIEIHITSDKNKNFVDNPVSFEPDELNKIISLIRSVKKINF